MSLKSLLSNYYGGVRGDTTALEPHRQCMREEKARIEAQKQLNPKFKVGRYHYSDEWANVKDAYTRNYYASRGIPQPVRAQKAPAQPRAPRAPRRPKKKDFVAQLISQGYPKSTANAQWRSMYPAKPRKPRADLENYSAYKQHRLTNCIIKNDPLVQQAQRNLKVAIDVAKARKQSNACRKYNQAENWILNAENPDDPFGLEMD